jgi:hypothetical protein
MTYGELIINFVSLTWLWSLWLVWVLFWSHSCSVIRTEICLRRR